jgi:plastocyanin
MRSLPIVRPFLLSGLLALTSCSSETTAPRGSTTVVSIQNFYFYPPIVAVRIGATVQWTNYDPVTHTTTSDAGLWDSGPLGGAAGGGGYGAGGGAGGSFRFTFTQRGAYDYHCSIHPPSSYPGFVGTIVVRP